ncbi:MAG: hypothetical protein CUN55_01220 [Phototrophicales bacterium]|nr:MAG: hypothetical protein CUN55_01220 [Phototrophicales bacterium]
MDIRAVKLDVAALRNGLAWAQSWTHQHILCRIGEGQLTFMVAERDGFLAAWTWNAPDLSSSAFFLIPPFIAKLLSSRAMWDVRELKVMTYRNAVGMLLSAGQRQPFRLQWHWHATDFASPPYFKLMSRLPDMMISAPYVNLADVIHLAIANVLTPSINEEGEPEPMPNGILIDFMPGQINIDGESIHSHTQQQARYYFNPKMLIRGLEIVRSSHLSFAIREAKRAQNAVLYMACQREGWQIHCAIQSVGVSRTATPPPVQIRETRPPMQGGSWFRGRGD